MILTKTHGKYGVDKTFDINCQLFKTYGPSVSKHKHEESVTPN